VANLGPDNGARLLLVRFESAEPLMAVAAFQPASSRCVDPEPAVLRGRDRMLAAARPPASAEHEDALLVIT